MHASKVWLVGAMVPLMLIGCAARDGEGDDTTHEAALVEAPADPGRCVGLTTRLFDDDLRQAAVEVLTPAFAPGYPFGVIADVPHALTIIGAAKDWPRVEVFGSPSLSMGGDSSDGPIETIIDVRGFQPSDASFTVAKTIFDAMTRVEAQTEVQGSTTVSTKKSSNGAMVCTRVASDGVDGSFECTFRVDRHDGPHGVQVGAVYGCGSTAEK